MVWNGGNGQFVATRAVTLLFLMLSAVTTVLFLQCQQQQQPKGQWWIKQERGHKGMRPIMIIWALGQQNEHYQAARRGRANESRSALALGPTELDSFLKRRMERATKMDLAPDPGPDMWASFFFALISVVCCTCTMKWEKKEENPGPCRREQGRAHVMSSRAWVYAVVAQDNEEYCNRS